MHPINISSQIFEQKKDKFKNEINLISTIANSLSKGKIVGWFQDKMEFGPRALGNRSIIADPRSEKMQKNLNLKIKFRESFRPFAPIVLKEKVSEWFNFKGNSPYMLLVSEIKNMREQLDKDKTSFLLSFSKKEKTIDNIKDSLTDMILPLINLDKNVFPENILIPQEKTKKLEDNSD